MGLLNLFAVIVFIIKGYLCWCPPLIPPKGTTLICEDPVYSQRLNCSTTWLPQGTIAKFRCLNEKKRIKGCILCFDDGVHRFRGSLGDERVNDKNLPCGIKQDSGKSELFLYGYDAPKKYQLENHISDFHHMGLNLQNQFRDAHGSPPLQLREDLSSLAQSWAERAVQTRSLDMASDRRYGQNVFLDSTGNVTIAVNDAIKNWYYAGLQEYNWNDVTENWDNPLALQFSQLVWKNSKFVGIGAASMNGNNKKKTVIVSLYDPPGNIIFDGEQLKSETSFTSNVRSAGSKHTA